MIEFMREHMLVIILIGVVMLLVTPVVLDIMFGILDDPAAEKNKADD